MDIIRRILPLVLMISMSTAVLVSAGQDDAGGAGYERILNILETFNIIENEDNEVLDSEQNVTRAEFAMMTARILGLSDDVNSSGLVFFDVPETHEAASAVKMLYASKIINGDRNGLFNPEGEIIYEEAVKMLVCALGYDLYAQHRGGYPTGYLLVASERRVIDKEMNSILGMPVKRGMAAQMIYNALETDIMEQTGFAAEERYIISTGKTLLTERLNIESGKGMVTATPFTRLTGTSALRDNEIEIDGKRFEFEAINFQDYLGYNVKYYVKKDKRDSGKETLIYIEPDGNSNTVLTIGADDIESLDGTTLNYWRNTGRNGSTGTARISKSAVVIYNGVYDKTFFDLTAADFDIASGGVRLLDNKGNGEYGVVFINSYNAYVIDRIDAVNFKLYFKDTVGSLELNPDDNIKLAIRRSGRIGDAFNFLKVDDLVLIAESRNTTDNKIADIIVSINKATGVVTEVNDDQTEVCIEGERYEISKLHNKTIHLGDEGVFYLDHENKVAASYLSVSNRYGYLLDVEMNDATLDKALDLKVFAENSEIKIYKTSKKNITLDGNSESLDKAFNELQRIMNTSDNMRIITYKADENNNLLEINLPTDNVSGITFDRNKLSRDRTVNQQEYTTKAFFSKFFIDTKTIVFDVRASDERDYVIRNQAYFQNASKYDVTAYDMDENMVAKVIVLGGGSTTQGNVSPYEFVSVIQKITRVRIEYEGNCIGVHCLYKGKEERFYVPSDRKEVADFVKKLKPGDAVRFNVNDKGLIDAVEYNNETNEPWFSVSDPKNHSSDPNDFYILAYDYIKDPNTIENRQANFYSGKITRLNLSGNTFVLQYGEDDIKPISLKPYNAFAHVYIYDEEKDTVTLGQINDLAVGDRIFMHEEYSALRTIVILRYK